MLGNREGCKWKTPVSEYVVFDLETTGVSPASDRVIEVSAVKVRSCAVVDTFSTLVDPGCHISESASAINGIYDSMVAGMPRMEAVLPEFLDFIGEDVLVGHNIHAFDLKFIYRDSRALFGKIPENCFIDTLHLARKCMPELAHHKLTDLAGHFGFATEGAHRALFDCHMTQQVYERLKQEERLFAEGKKQIPRCEKCGKPLKLRNGKFGVFWGCSGYPYCTFTRNC